MLNAGWIRSVKTGNKWKRERENTTKIVIDLPDEAWDEDWGAVEQALMAHKPDGDGWRLAGYSREVCAESLDARYCPE